MTGSSLGTVLAWIRGELTAAGIDNPATEARLMVQEIANVSTADLIARPEHPLDGPIIEQLKQAAKRRVAGEPVHRILGHRLFHGLDLQLSPQTLEPRPDTEVLVDLVLPFLTALESAGTAPDILDIGTGTGAIALALLKEIPVARAVATDVSPDALSTAHSNAVATGLDHRIEFVRSNWFAAIDGAFHLIVSNPPYIRSGDISGLAREVRDHDPLAALDGGADGLDAYRHIAGGARQHLVDGGRVAVEIGFDQGKDVIALFGSRGFTLETIRQDLGGNDRAIVFTG